MQNYILSSSEIALCWATGLSGLPYAKRHWDASNNPLLSTSARFGHRLIMTFEAIPVIGGLLAIIERIVAVCCRCSISIPPKAPITTYNLDPRSVKSPPLLTQTTPPNPEAVITQLEIASETACSSENFSELFSDIPPPAQPLGCFWLFSNENNQDKTLQELEQRPAHGNIFIGTGCAFSLDAFSVRGQANASNREVVDHLIIMDISPQVQTFWATIGKIVKESESRIEALEKLKIAFPNHPVSNCALGRGWLATDAQFERVKRVFIDNKFAFILSDITNAETLKQIGARLQRSRCTVDTIYESNIASFARSYNLSMLLQTYIVKPTLTSSSDRKYFSIFAEGGGCSPADQRLVEYYVKQDATHVA